MALLLRGGCFFFLMGIAALPRVQAKMAEPPAVFVAFNDWWQSYVDATEADRPLLIEKGVKLAAQRKIEMLQLIKTDPETALAVAFPEEYHNALPQPIADAVEEHVRSLAQLTVVPGRKSRVVTIDEQSWKAYLYGYRLELASRDEIPIHGIILEDLMAVDGSPLERFPDRPSLLESLRQAEGKKTCSICGKAGVIPAAVGDILLWFDTEEDLEICEKALIEKESRPEAEEYLKKSK